MNRRVAKIFMNGRSQAVRLPKDCRFDCNEVYVRKHDGGILLTPRKPTWDDFFNQQSAFSQDFLPHRDDALPQDRDF